MKTKYSIFEEGAATSMSRISGSSQKQGKYVVLSGINLKIHIVVVATGP